MLGLLLIGLLLLLVSWGSEWIARLPLSYAILYLVIGVVLGPYGIELIRLQPNTEFLEHFTEFVVIVSLYSCGLKINRPLSTDHWNSTIRLIAFLMPLSIAAVAAVGHGLIAMSWAAAVLLGAILSPTDPVLASEVQLDHAEDPNELRHSGDWVHLLPVLCRHRRVAGGGYRPAALDCVSDSDHFYCCPRHFSHSLGRLA
jgi:sodium/hydrogen antiporter